MTTDVGKMHMGRNATVWKLEGEQAEKHDLAG